MIFRVVGLLTGALCLILTGVFLSAREKKSFDDVKLVSALLTHLRREISYRRTELGVCFSSFFAANDHPSGGEFIAGNYDRALSRLILPPALSRQLSVFFSLLGKGEAAEEEKRVCEMLEVVSDYEKSGAKRSPEKRRVYITLGVCAAAVLLLLFL